MDIFEFRERGTSGVDERTEWLAQQVIGTAIEVHRLLKPGRPESVYKRAISHELTIRGIPHITEHPIKCVYKGLEVGESFIDLFVEQRLVVELKAVDALTEVHKAQVIGYLQSANLQLGLLINFNVPLLKNGVKRIINSYQK